MLALAVGVARLVDAQAKVKIMALGDSITGSPVRDMPSDSRSCLANQSERTGLLAGRPLAETPGRRHQEHGLCGNAPWSGLWLYLRRGERGPRRIPGHEHRQTEPVGGLALPDQARRCYDAPGDQRCVEQHSTEHDTCRLRNAYQSNASQQSDDENSGKSSLVLKYQTYFSLTTMKHIGRTNHPDASVKLCRLRAAGREFEQSNHGVGSEGHKIGKPRHGSGLLDGIRHCLDDRRWCPPQCKGQRCHGEVLV